MLHMKCSNVAPCNADEDKPKLEFINGVQADYDDMRFDLNVLWLLGFCTVVSLSLMIAAIILFDQQETNYFMGKDAFPYTPDMWPSFMRQVEHQYTVNMCFRATILLSMPFRIYLAFVLGTLLLKNKWNNALLWKGYCLGNSLINFTAVIEILSQVIFSVNTLRFDNPTLYQYGFTSFVIASTIYMWMRILLQLFKNRRTDFDTSSLLIKIICAAIYTTNIFGFYNYHLKFILEPTCHPYVHKEEAFQEYLIILSYLFFNLTILIDVRNVRLICYPTSSLSEKREIILSKYYIADK